MESNEKLKQIDIKDLTSYYFHDVIKIEDFDLDNTLIDEKSYENMLVYNISYKSLTDCKPLRIRFDEIDGFITVYDGTRYLINVKSGITYIISHNYATIKVDSYDFAPLEKTVTIRNVTILVKSV